MEIIPPVSSSIAYISRHESIFGSSEKSTKAKQNPRKGKVMQTNAAKPVSLSFALYHSLRFALEKILHFFFSLHPGVRLHVSASVCLLIGYIYESPPSPYSLIVPHTRSAGVYGTITPLHVMFSTSICVVYPYSLPCSSVFFSM